MTVGTGLTSMPNLTAKTQALWNIHLSFRPAVGTDVAGPSATAFFGVSGASSADGGYTYNGYTHSGASVGLWVDISAFGISRRSLLELRGGGSIGQYRNTNNMFFTPHVAMAWLHPLGRSTGIWRWWAAPSITWSVRDPDVTTITLAVSVGGGIATTPFAPKERTK